MSDKTFLVVDVGGTNIRLARAVEHQLFDIESYQCSQFPNIDMAIKQYIDKLACKNIVLCLAVASPVVDEVINMTNLDWSFSKAGLKNFLNLEQLFVINDYFAIACSVPALSDNEKYQVGGDQNAKAKHAPIAVCGPGTGLGVAHLVHVNNQWQVLEGEGGHMDLAANEPKQEALIKLIGQKYSHVSAERLLSGPGLLEIYQGLCSINNVERMNLSSEQISERAINRSCPVCFESLSVFFSMLGSFSGNLALNLATFGGVYIAGGIVPKMLGFFVESEFRFQFENKGRYKKYNAAIPTFVITHPYPGLKGAANYLSQVYSVS